MTPEQRRRAGRAVAARIAEMNATPTSIARAAEVSAATVRALIKGTHWPTDHVQDQIEMALRWRRGEIHARSVGGDGQLDGFTDLQLAQELTRRIRVHHERDLRQRGGDRKAATGLSLSGNLVADAGASRLT